MTEPVFVIHGVANRDEDGFRRTVDTLSAAVARELTAPVELVPVYWGDLGARNVHLDAVIPGRTRAPRGGGNGDDILLAQVLGTATSAPRGLDPAGVVTDAAAAAADRRARSLAPGSGSPARDPAMQAAVREAWPTLEYLPLVRDQQLLVAVGQVLGDQGGQPQGPLDGPPDGARPRGAEGPGPASWVRDRLHDIDALVGRLAGNVAGSLNATLRATTAPAVAHLLGDVMVYQRRWELIRGRVRERVAAFGAAHGTPALGSPEAPVRLIGHSLGGVIAADLAVADPDPLHTALLVTFGSQWPLFHLMDPRGTLAEYDGERVRLPASLARWVNLWEPLDPLAFVAGQAFDLADGRPEDVEVPHLVTSGWFTHSAYWELDTVAAVIAERLGAAG